MFAESGTTFLQLSSRTWVAHTDIRTWTNPAGGERCYMCGRCPRYHQGGTLLVYPPSIKDFAPASIVAGIEETSVASFSSEARVLSGGVEQPTSRAIETLHDYGAQNMKVITNPPRDATAYLRAAFGTARNIELVGSIAGCDLSCRLGTNWQIPRLPYEWRPRPG